MAAKKTEASFEAKMNALEKLVAEMETGAMPLDKAMESYTQGMALAVELEKQLAESKQRLEIMDGSGAPEKGIE